MLTPLIKNPATKKVGSGVSSEKEQRVIHDKRWKPAPMQDNIPDNYDAVCCWQHEPQRLKPAR
jgi:hypothetical protein